MRQADWAGLPDLIVLAHLFLSPGEFRLSHQAYRTSKLGYLTEPMFGYALARYSWLRGETSPAWAEHLDTNPRTYLSRG